MLQPRPVTLVGSVARLEPLTLDHVGELAEVGADPALWEWTTSSAHTPELMRAYVEEGLRAQEQGSALPFVTIARESGRIVGATRFGNIDVEPTRIYKTADAAAFLKTSGLESKLASDLDGRFMSAFVRAQKPAAAKACCGPDCCS